MGYYVRVLSTSAECVSLETLQEVVRNGGFKAELQSENGTHSEWEQIILRHTNGSEIASIERNLVDSDSLGGEEITEFSDEIKNCKPASAVTWLDDYFKRVKCIYAFQVLSGTEKENGWDILDAVKSAIWKVAPGILQADREGFSNEDGYHILWQFSDSVTGSYNMGVLKHGKWIHFQMDFGNKKHRDAFFNGENPFTASASLFSRLKNLFLRPNE